MKRNLAIDIPDLLRRAEEILGIDAAVEMKPEHSAPIADAVMAAALRPPEPKRAPKRIASRQPRRKPVANMETISWNRPRCPRCNGIALLKYRSVADQGDGSSLAWMRCNEPECGHRFKMVME